MVSENKEDPVLWDKQLLAETEHKSDGAIKVRANQRCKFIDALILSDRRNEKWSLKSS